MGPLLIVFAVVLVGLVGVFPFVDDASRFVGGLPVSLVIIVAAQFVLIGLHMALARKVRARAIPTDTPRPGSEEVGR